MPMPEGIAVINSEELKPGALGDLFNKGAKVVILKDPRISQIWEEFLEPQNCELGYSPHSTRMPWDDNLFTIARNHVPNNEFLGDMVRFAPENLGHFARKMKIFPGPDGSSIQAIPDFFIQGIRKFSYPNAQLQTVWELMSDVLNSTLPENRLLPPYAVKIDLLKYPNSDGLTEMFSLLSDSFSFGRWAQIGQKIDDYKGMAKGIFNTRFLRDLFGLLLLLPGINPVLRKINSGLSKKVHDPLLKDWLIIGKAHVDVSKFLTALASERDILKTQVYIGEGWVDLPLTSDSLAIFPSQKITKQIGLAPTWHRILLKKTPLSSEEPKKNVTLSLAIVEL